MTNFSLCVNKFLKSIDTQLKKVYNNNRAERE